MNKFSKRILSSDLPKLSSLIKELVNDGLWFLYENKDQERKYFLITGKEKRLTWKII